MDPGSTFLGWQLVLITLAGIAAGAEPGRRGIQSTPRRSRKSSSPAIRASLEELDRRQARSRPASPTRSSPRTSASFPIRNIAESFNRIPGITITREITGEGLNIAIRGLGTNFTRVLLNSAPVAVASTGRTDAPEHQSRGRPRPVSDRAVHAAQREQEPCGQHARRRRRRHASNMRSARPFDNPRHAPHLSRCRARTTANADTWGARGSVLAQQDLGQLRRADRRRRRAQQGAHDRVTRRSAGPTPT